MLGRYVVALLLGFALVTAGGYSQAAVPPLWEAQVAAGDSEELLARAVTLRDAGEYHAALVVVDGLLRISPENKRAWNVRGLIYQRLGRHGEAVRDFSTAASLDRFSWVPLFNRGTSYLDQRNFLSAIADFTAAVELEPTAEIAYVNRGSALRQSGDYARALDDFSTAIRLNPRDSIAFFNRGLALVDLGRRPEAVQAFSEAIALDSSDQDAFKNRGIVYSLMGDFGAAIQDLNQYLAASPNDSQALAARAFAKAEAGRRDESIVDYSSAIALAPQDASLLYSRAVTYGELSRFDEALNDINSALRLDPSNAQYGATRDAIRDNQRSERSAQTSALRDTLWACLGSAVVRLERSGERADLVAEAVLVTCRSDLRAVARTLGSGNLHNSALEAAFRPRLLADILDIRARRNR